MSKRFLCLCFFILCLQTVYIYAQYEIPFVDVEATVKEVEKLKSSNVDMQARINEMEKENTNLVDQIQKLESEKLKLELLLEKVVPNGGMLYANYLKIKDEATKTKAWETVQKNYQLQGDIKKRLNIINETLNKSKVTIKENNKQVSINQKTIKVNNDTIVLKEAAIAKTKDQQSEIEDYINYVDGFLKEAQTTISEQPASGK